MSPLIPFICHHSYIVRHSVSDDDSTSQYSLRIRWPAQSGRLLLMSEYSPTGPQIRPPGPSATPTPTGKGAAAADGGAAPVSMSAAAAASSNSTPCSAAISARSCAQARGQSRIHPSSLGTCEGWWVCSGVHTKGLIVVKRLAEPKRLGQYFSWCIKHTLEWLDRNTGASTQEASSLDRCGTGNISASQLTLIFSWGAGASMTRQETRFSLTCHFLRSTPDLY